MRLFSALLERLAFTPARTVKLALLRAYFAEAPDPDRGYALAAIAGTLVLPAARRSLIRDIATARVDPVLFELSYDYVGDLAETVALIWPAREAAVEEPPSVSLVVETLRAAAKSEMPGIMERWLDASTPSVRYAILKLMTGGLRVGASGRLAKTALAEIAGIAPDEIEEIWHGLEPPYRPLFDWIEGCEARPDPAGAPVFRPPMLAHPLEDADLAALDPEDWRAEWKWDGIRVQLVRTAGGVRLYSRTAENVGAAFPEILDALDATGETVALDGELLVLRDGEAAPFAELQQRLNRKTPTGAMMARFPAFVRLYDILFDNGEDVRGLAFDARRKRLEAWVERVRPERMDLSRLIPFADFSELAALREAARAASIEGLMLKRGASAYLPGRPRGMWWKWKRAPLTVDAVLMYAQRGHGKRSSYYSDFTFGLWREGEDGPELVPIGKAYFGFTDEELRFLDRWVRHHTTGRFGPVREVEKALVLEIAFDAAQRSTRHKSGIALRFPRIARIRADKPAHEADRLDAFMKAYLAH